MSGRRDAIKGKEERQRASPHYTGGGDQDPDEVSSAGRKVSGKQVSGLQQEEERGFEAPQT